MKTKKIKGYHLRWHRGGWELKSTLRERGQRYAGRFLTRKAALVIAKDLMRYARERVVRPMDVVVYK